MDTYYREYNANVHRGIYTIGEKATAEYERARAQGREAHRRRRPARDRVRAQRHRGDQPRRLLVGPQAHRPRRRDRADRDGAPREPRPVADPRPGEGRRPRVHPDHRRRDPAPGRVRRPAQAQAQAGRVHPRVEHAGHDQPGRGHDAPGPRGGRAGADRRRPGRAARPGRRPGDRLRLLRVQRPQDAGADRVRARCGAAGRCSRRCRRSSPAAR